MICLFQVESGVYLGKIYLERTGRNEQAAIDERLKNLEQDHIKLLTKGEQFHQISQKTYEKIFEKKVEVYMKLVSLKQYYLSSKEIFNLPDKTMTSHNRDLDAVLKLKETVEENRFYLSTELIEAYDQWYEHACKYFISATEDALSASIESIDWNEQQRFFLQHTIKGASNKQLNTMLEETKIFIALIFATIDIDVKNLKIRYDI